MRPAALIAAPPELPGWAASEQSGVSLTAGALDAVAVWSDSGRRYARRVSHTAQPLGWLQLPEEAQRARLLRVETDGRDYAAVWIPDDHSTVRFARLVDEVAPPASVETLAETGVSPQGLDAEWDGSAYVVVWHGKGDPYSDLQPVYTARVSRDGALIAPGIEARPPVKQLRRYGFTLTRGDGAMLLAWTEAGAGWGLPCSGCTNPRGARAMLLDAGARPAGTVAELSGSMSELQTAVWNDGAWYVVARELSSTPRPVSRIDPAGNVRSARVPIGDRPPVPMGELGLGWYADDQVRLLDPATLQLEPWGYGWGMGGDEPREVRFVRAGNSRILAIFTARVNTAPYNGVHRAFVSTYELTFPLARRRRARP